MARYSIIEKLFLGSPTPDDRAEIDLLQQAVVRTYAAVLVFLARAKAYWTKSTPKRFARAFLDDIEALCRDLLLKVAHADQSTDRLLRLIGFRKLENKIEILERVFLGLLSGLKTPYERTAKKIDDIHDHLKQDQRKEILRWISAIPCETHHRDNISTVLAGTGTWLLTCEEYRQWQTSSTSSFIWLSGVPGCGKTKLAALVAETYLERHRTQSSQPPPLGYFYCSRRGGDDQDRSNPSEILRAILRQLCSRTSQALLRGAVAQAYQQIKELADDVGSQPNRFTIADTVSQILRNTEADPVVIIIDALVEMDLYVRDDLFAALTRIVGESLNVIKVFLSSRRDADICLAFDGCTSVCVDEGMNHTDIDNFVVHEVDRAIRRRRLLRGRVSESARLEITSTLTSKAQGM